MKKINYLLMLLISSLIVSCTGVNNEVLTLSSGVLKIGLDDKGLVTSLTDVNSGKNFILKDSVSPLMSIRIDNVFEDPSSMDVTESAGSKLISLKYAKSASEVIIEAVEKDGYVTFEVKEVKSPAFVEIAQWGPYATIIAQRIGETIGVTHDDEYAIGIQALNIKTLGGFPVTEDDQEPAFDIFATSSLVDIQDSIKIHYRGHTAKMLEGAKGSIVQAYCRDRSKERIIATWGHDSFVAPAHNDGGLIGTKIALFGCEKPNVLDVIEKIEIGEGLPHPMLNGEWAKRAPEASQSYIIYDFNDKNVQNAIDFTKRVGLKYFYHGGPFSEWGHFVPSKNAFPKGWESIKACVDQAKAEGLKIGVHSLSNFITTNDAYVTPVPDKRLAKVGSSVLSSDVKTTDKNIVIENPDYFNQMTNNTLHGVMIGDELVRYEKVSDSAPWTLINCQRGAWGTTAASHSKGAEISKLFDHGYNTFLSNTDLSVEISHNLAKLFNETGLHQFSFDGLEGNFSTGLGTYGPTLMFYEWYNNLNADVKDCVVDASMPTHFNWHLATRYNWGEPWYAGFRESQLNYRLMNQDYYRRNFMPCMLGWFSYGSTIGIEDVEWLLARAAGYDAGFALVTNQRSIDNNKLSDINIKAIREWEEARMRGAFPNDLKKEMEAIANEYHLEQTSDKTWNINHLAVSRFKHNNIVRQPGEPVISKWEFESPNERQPVRFIIKANDDISDATITIGNYSTIGIKGVVKKGENIKYDGGDNIVVYSPTWDVVREVPVDKSIMNVDKGKTMIVFSCGFASSDTEKFASAEIKTAAPVKELTATRDRK